MTLKVTSSHVRVSEDTHISKNYCNIQKFTVLTHIFLNCAHTLHWGKSMEKYLNGVVESLVLTCISSTQ